MKKAVAVILAAVIVLAGVYFVGSGFLKATDVFIEDFAVSEDGAIMTLTLGVAGSAGSVRKAAIHQQQGGKMYLDCYYAFGGFNGSIGAKKEYEVPLDADTEIIALFRNENCYEEALKKDEDGNWQRVQ